MSKLLHSITFPTHATATKAMDILTSGEQKLCVATHKGILIYELRAKAKNSNPELNFYKFLLPVNPTTENSHIGAILEDIPDHQCMLFNREYPGNVKVVKWIPKGILLNNQPALVTLTDDHWLKISRFKGTSSKEPIDLSGKSR